MSMKDLLIGKVKYVLDGKTFDLEVTGKGKKNSFRYDSVERIHINNLKTSNIVSLVGPFTRTSLEKILRGNEVMCLVNSKNGNGQVDADVFII